MIHILNIFIVKNLVLLDAGITIFSKSLIDYGVLGVFVGVLLLVVRGLVREYKEQNEEFIKLFNDRIKEYINEREEIEVQKNKLNEKFLDHLKSNETELLKIIGENSNAFKMLSKTNEEFVGAITLLIKHIGKE